MPCSYRSSLALVAACLLASGPSRAEAPPGGAQAYFASVQKLAASRAQLSAAYREARSPKERAKAVERARRHLMRAIVEDLIPAWYGTRWEFYGTSETPGEGAIACGYFVSTVLRDAGFRVERVRLAQQASENIVLTLVPAPQIRRYRGKSPGELLAAVRAELGDGLFVVGLDYHVGFLRIDGERAWFCHSAYLTPGAVVCEQAARAAGLSSGYYVVGRLLTDAMMARWLEGRAFRTWGAAR
ncbi:MAG: hypothetical protein ACOX6T_06930 [Myxococcales bacterium]|jgi:hypothetical protein